MPGTSRDRMRGAGRLQPSPGRRSAGRIGRRDFRGANSRSLFWTWRNSLFFRRRKANWTGLLSDTRAPATWDFWTALRLLNGERRRPMVAPALACVAAPPATSAIALTRGWRRSVQQMSREFNALSDQPPVRRYAPHRAFGRER